MLLHLFGDTLTGAGLALLVTALVVALGFEFVNGFHDTANAVATVIYTRSLPPRAAVVWSGVCNFVGVNLGGTAVAFSIVNLLPADLLVSGKPGAALAMVLALLIAAILWNLGTWFLGLPASSSHTLIGAILGVGLAHALLSGGSVATGVNWAKAGEVGVSLLVSPLIGFLAAAGLLLAIRRLIPDPKLFEPASPDAPPPTWVRATLIATSTGVSLAHGSNDGQKGVGLVMLILIGILPAHYALNPTHGAAEVGKVLGADDALRGLIERHVPEADRPPLLDSLTEVHKTLDGKTSLREVPDAERWALRGRLILLGRALERLEEHPPAGLKGADRAKIRKARESLSGAVDYAPTWVLAAVAGALGCGTMVGWKRIVVTVGEKIGKTHLTYAQGASAEVVAAATIGLADFAGMPVSTTHVLSSGVAGTMAANRSGLQFATVRAILLAWVLTLPVAMLLAAGLFTVLRPLLAGIGADLHP